MTVELHGYQRSVYARIARMALHEKRVGYTWREIDPFADNIPQDYLAMHPFRRVPTLVHDGFVIYETSAITRYIDEAFDGPRLQPDDPAARARMAQIVSIIDSYGYWPIVRQVFAQRVFRHLMGHEPDEIEIREGLAASQDVLRALESLNTAGHFLVGEALSLADVHLAPMLAYFTLAPEGVAQLAGYPRLSGWWGHMANRPSVVGTDPNRPIAQGEIVNV